MCSWRSRWCGLLAACWIAGAPSAVAYPSPLQEALEQQNAERQNVERNTFLVHLPSAPVEAANRQAGAITRLARYLSERLPDRTIETKIYRRWRDARQNLERQPENLALMLADASFVASESSGLRPAYRFVHRGSETYRRLLVVRTDREGALKLADLRNASLAIVETAGSSDASFLRSQVFGGELDPVAWFAAISPTVDDFSATASVLYGQTDAALVAEYNPLLIDHLENDLRVVFESPEISLPVLWVHDEAFPAESLQALQAALASLTEDADGVELLAELGIEGFSRLRSVADLTSPPARRDKVLAIALPTGGELELPEPPPPAPADLTFSVAIELPDIPLPVESGDGSQTP
ncbi:MAG: PhnD/SsuA/transferrin family substrate-binding protein [Acidobacteriota bacterium]